MPDFERLFRYLDVELCNTEEERKIKRSFYMGVDKTRWQIALIFLGSVTLGLVIYWIW